MCEESYNFNDFHENHLLENPEHLRIVKNAVIKTLSDGSVCIVDMNNVDCFSEIQNQNLPSNSVSCKENIGNNLITDTATKASEIQKNSSSAYKCAKCEKCFDKIASYSKHMRCHEGIKKYKCTKCAAGYNVEVNLTIHMAMHSEDKPTCPLCNISFQRLASLKSHLMLHQVEELYTCEECAAEFEKEEELLKHIQSHAANTSENNLVCPYCNVHFDELKTYKEHISHHVKVKKMILSGKKTRRVHVNKEYPHTCSVCLKRFSRMSLLERHLRVHSGERPFVCMQCNRGFNQKGTLQIHLSKHTGIKPFHCTLCSAKFNQKGNLRVHVEKTHIAPKPGVKMYKCSHCTCIFKKIASLNVHITKSHASVEANGSISNVMSQLKQLEEQTAVICGTKVDIKGYEEKNNARYENRKTADIPNTSYVKLAESFLDGTVRQYLVMQKKVDDIRWYICSYCNKEFKKPSDLIRHTRVHTREKPFMCKQCGSSFSLKSTLLCHIKTHSSSNIYMCAICNKNFSAARSLHSHLKKHSEKENEIYKCNMYTKTFDSLQQIKQHYDEVHTEPEKDLVQFLEKQPLHHTSKGLQPEISSKLRQSTDKGEKIQCHICDLKFTKLHNLNRHLLMHNGERKFKCDQCFKSYYTSHALKEHLLFHSDGRKFDCRICGRKYATASLLKRHAISHTLHKPYICPYCNKNFKSVALCTKHMNIHKKQMSMQVNNSEEQQNTNESCDLNIQLSEISTDRLEDTELAKHDLPVFSESVSLNSPGTDNTFVIENSNICEVPYKVIQQGEEITSHTLETLPDIDKNAKQNLKPVHTIFINCSDVQFSNNINPENSESVFLNALNDLHDGNVFSVESLNDIVSTQNVTIYDSSQLFSVNQVINDNETNAKSDSELTNNNCEIYSSNFIQAKQNNYKTNVTSISENTDPNDLSFCSPSDLNLFNIDSETKSNNSDLLNDNINLADINLTRRQMLTTELHQEVVSEIEDDKTKKKKITYDRSKKKITNRNCYSRPVSTYVNWKKNGIKLHHCSFCSKGFKKQSDLIRHIRTHTGEKPFACDKCDKKFSLKSTLLSHQRTHNPVSHKHYSCVVCNTFFTSKSSLKVHMSLHTGNKSHECSFCSIKFRTTAHKKSHEANHHKNPSKKRKNKITHLLASVAMDSTLINLQNKDQTVPREDLEKVLVVEEPLSLVDDHLNLLDETTSNVLNGSNELEPIIIQELQPSFLLTDTVVSPSVIQLDDGTVLNIKCAETQQAQQESTNMSLEKPRTFTCEICSKKYASKDVLRKHKKIHGVNKKFPCTKCDKGFDLEEDLEKHDRTHVGFRPYLCMYCSNSFSKEHGLTTHMKRIHNISISDDNLLLSDLR